MTIWYTCLLLGLALLLNAGLVDASDNEEPSARVDENNLYLESTFIGDKEQPTVSYFIPWKNTGTPDKLNWNLEEKYDKSLELIDRDIMLRSISIYNDLEMEGSGITE